MSAERCGCAPDYGCDSIVSGACDELRDRARRALGGRRPYRWFDDRRRKRKVFVKVRKSFGDWHHWYADLEEESNPFWFPGDDKDGPCWVEDNRSRGECFGEKFRTEDGANAYVKIIMRDHFPNHRAVRGDDRFTRKRERTWLYAREGD